MVRLFVAVFMAFESAAPHPASFWEMTKKMNMHAYIFFDAGFT